MNGDGSEEMKEMWSISLKVMREILENGSSISSERMDRICGRSSLRDKIMKANVFMEHWDSEITFDSRFVKAYAQKLIDEENQSSFAFLYNWIIPKSK